MCILCEGNFDYSKTKLVIAASNLVPLECVLMRVRDRSCRPQEKPNLADGQRTVPRVLEIFFAIQSLLNYIVQIQKLQKSQKNLQSLLI